MADKTFRGTGVALVTPFTRDGSLDLEAVQSLVEWHLNSGMEMIVPAGTTGEAATLNRSEFGDLVGAVVQTVNGKVPVIAGTGTNNTRKVIEMSQFAESMGVDGVLVVSPYYNKPTQNGLYEHYKTVAGAIDIPVVLYNVPGRTGGNISAETTLRLAEIPNIVAIKEASGNFSQIMHIIAHRPDDFSVLSGDDADAFQIVALGGDGVISVAANEVPAEFTAMIRLALAGDFGEARKLQYKLLPLMEGNFIETNPLPVKAVLAAMGKIQEVYRLPLVPMTDAHKQEILDIAGSLGLLS